MQAGRGWRSDAGTALWECREVSWDQENTLAQTDASATGGGSPSLIADAWRTRTFAEAPRMPISSYFPCVFCANSRVFAANQRPEPSLAKMGEVKSRKSNQRHAP